MKHGKILTIGYVMAVTLAPLSVNAATMETGLDACADALVTELADDTGNPVNYRVSPESDISGSRLKQTEVIHLDVHDPESEEVVARADCVVSRQGKVRRLISVPLEAADAAERASSL